MRKLIKSTVFFVIALIAVACGKNGSDPKPGTDPKPNENGKWDVVKDVVPSLLSTIADKYKDQGIKSYTLILPGTGINPPYSENQNDGDAAYLELAISQLKAGNWGYDEKNDVDYTAEVADAKGRKFFLYCHVSLGMVIFRWASQNTSTHKDVLLAFKK